MGHREWVGGGPVALPEEGAPLPLSYCGSEARALRTTLPLGGPGVQASPSPAPKRGRWTREGAAGTQEPVGSPGAQAAPHLQGPCPVQVGSGAGGHLIVPGPALAHAPTQTGLSGARFLSQITVPGDSAASDSVTARVTLWDAARASTRLPTPSTVPPSPWQRPRGPGGRDPSPLSLDSSKPPAYQIRVRGWQ